MKHKRKGFTLIEIMLFLAITSLLFVGIIVGTNNSIAQQRFNDSVQNFAELLKSVYSEVSNPQSVGDGRSDVAIYGKLITFGERYGLDGKRIADKYEQRIFIYDVVGRADNAGSGKVTEALKELQANVVVVTERDELGNIMEMGPAGEVQSYVLRWGASLEKVEQKDILNPGGNLFTGSMLIVRHPQSGTINTLFSNTVIKVNETLNTVNEDKDFTKATDLLTSVLARTVRNGGFGAMQIDFCINPAGAEKPSEIRRDIRLTKNNRNVSGVEIVDLDLNEIRHDASGVDEQIGNKCRFSN
ncbi:prepilin-type N-terminal cleavage/methylation domain-containing protein [Candidatus Saccharibacteria bacterium]|nr:prepilin-type N-terminal cleavage/methylation domain-containing protein [Candidatus Saccharibacteria bacterium]